MYVSVTVSATLQIRVTSVLYWREHKHASLFYVVKVTCCEHLVQSEHFGKAFYKINKQFKASAKLPHTKF